MNFWDENWIEHTLMKIGVVINCELDGVVKPKTPDELEEIPDEWLIKF